jgi:DNA-binding PadR family transcriptional regulator
VRDHLDRWADPPLLVLASLADEPKHGYAITQDVADTMGVRLSAGTLYAVIARLTGSRWPGRRRWLSNRSG